MAIVGRLDFIFTRKLFWHSPNWFGGVGSFLRSMKDGGVRGLPVACSRPGLWVVFVVVAQTCAGPGGHFRLISKFIRTLRDRSYDVIYDTSPRSLRLFPRIFAIYWTLDPVWTPNFREELCKIHSGYQKIGSMGRSVVILTFYNRTPLGWAALSLWRDAEDSVHHTMPCVTRSIPSSTKNSTPVRQRPAAHPYPLFHP